VVGRYSITRSESMIFALRSVRRVVGFLEKPAIGRDRPSGE
jgi:hypothetical protein